MSSHLDDTGTGHPILGFLDLLEAGLDDIKDTPAWSLNAAETTDVLRRLSADLARLAEVESRAIGHGATLDLSGDLGVSSMSKWLARSTRQTKGEAGRRAKLAKTLDAHPRTREAVAAGEVLPEQALVIGAAVEALGEAYATERAQAEAFLIEKAGEVDAHGLRLLGLC